MGCSMENRPFLQMFELPFREYMPFSSTNPKWLISYLRFYFNSKQIICPFGYARKLIFWHEVPFYIKGVPEANIFAGAAVVSELCTNTKDWLFKAMGSAIVNHTDSKP